MTGRAWSIGLVVAGASVVACDSAVGDDAGGGNTSVAGSGGHAQGGSAAGGQASGGQAQGGAAQGGAAQGGAAQGGSGGAGGDGGFPWDSAVDPNGAPSSTRLTAFALGATDAGQGFYEYLPAGYPSGVKWPLLVALHGVGENGNGIGELTKVLNTGIPKLIDQDNWPVERPFVVLMPQHTPGGACPGASEIQAFIDYGLTHYEIDPRYVYLTGLSCGAIGSWSYLAQHQSSQIAALVVVAGDGTGAWNNIGCDLAKVGIWAFHGLDDTTVYPVGTNYPMDNLATCASPPALETKKTLYPGVGHNSWDRTYDLSEGHDIYTWMLGFTHTL